MQLTTNSEKKVKSFSYGAANPKENKTDSDSKSLEQKREISTSINSTVQNTIAERSKNPFHLYISETDFTAPTTTNSAKSNEVRVQLPSHWKQMNR